MEKVSINTEYIKLDQFLKWTGASDNGAEAKIMIAEGKVKVNGVVEMQRGKKIRNGDKVQIGKKEFVVEKAGG